MASKIRQAPLVNPAKNELFLLRSGGVIYSSVTDGPMVGLPEQLRRFIDQELNPRGPGQSRGV